MDFSRINPADDTTAGQGRGRYASAAAPQKPCFRFRPGPADWPNKKGGSKAAFSQKAV
jgi:hypothetical protein